MCEHERLKTIGDRVFCCICKAELPLEFLINQGKPAEPPAPEQEPGAGVNDNKPAEQEHEAPEQVPGEQNQAENQADGEKPGKTPGRKKAAKTAV